MQNLELAMSNFPGITDLVIDQYKFKRESQYHMSNENQQHMRGDVSRKKQDIKLNY